MGVVKLTCQVCLGGSDFEAVANVREDFLTKWNPTQEDPAEWLEYAEEHGVWRCD
jgi:hypothetical protein